MLAQVIEMYSENGLDRPFFCTFATPWSGNVIRILNTGPMEYPLTASVVRPCWRVRFRHPAAAVEGKRMSCHNLCLGSFANRCGAHTGERILKLMWRLRYQQGNPFHVGPGRAVGAIRCRGSRRLSIE